MGKKIVCAHLLNDFSGSPLIFSMAINGLTKNNHEVDLYTSGYKSEQGFLSNLNRVNTYHFFYKWSPYKVLTLFFFMLSQFNLFIKLLKYNKQDIVIYINTILPFGAALSGKLLNKRVIYHIHETSVRPKILKKFLLKVMALSASDIIYVSDYLRAKEPFPNINMHTVYNALKDDFLEKTLHHKINPESKKKVLMLCSFKEYKGIYQYVELAKRCPQFNFLLVLNTSQDSVDKFLNETNSTPNLKIFPAQSDVHKFYKDVGLVLNLSIPNQWIETFGMTALEAMSYSIPVIVPPVGGPAELVTDGYNGYKVDARNMDELVSKTNSILNSPELYNSLSKNALQESHKYSENQFTKDILRIIVN